MDTLTIGELNIKNQTFYVLDIPSDAGTPQMAVGWEFMQMFAVEIDPKRNEITFFEGTHFRYQGKGEAVPIFLHLNGNGIDVNAKADGIEGRFLVDSGNQFGTFISSVFVAKNNLVQKLNARYRGYNGRGFGGDSPPAWYVRLHSFKVGKLKIKGPVSRLQTANDSFNDKLAGNIGQDILNRFIVTVDCNHAVMYLEKTPSWSKPTSFNRTGMLVDYNHYSDEIKTVFPGSPADAAGLRQGDRILTINGTKPSDDPNEPLFKQPVGTVLYLQVQRGELSQRFIYQAARPPVVVLQLLLPRLLSGITKALSSQKTIQSCRSEPQDRSLQTRFSRMERKAFSQLIDQHRESGFLRFATE